LKLLHIFVNIINLSKKLQVQLVSYKATIISKEEGEFILESYDACMVESPLYVATCTLYIMFVNYNEVNLHEVIIYDYLPITLN